MLEAIRYNLANLTNLEGRDARQTFWYYVLFLVVIQFGIGILASVPMYVTIFSAVFEATSQGADPDTMMRGMVEDMVGQIRVVTMIGIVTGVVAALLIIASFVRRLHDAGYTGLIVLIPLATQAFSLIFTMMNMDRIDELMMESMTQSMANPNGGGPNMFALQAEMGLSGLVGYIGYIVVIVFGVFKSQDGPNKYGDAPVQF